MAKRNNKIINTFSVTFDDDLWNRMLEKITERGCTKTRFVREAVTEKLARDEAASTASAAPPIGKMKRRR